jgi:hypothetical protein
VGAQVGVGRGEYRHPIFCKSFYEKLFIGVGTDEILNI